MIKLIATDMDGTLLKSNGQLPHEFSAVLNNLIDKEVMFCVASGRQYFTLRDNMAEFKDKITFIAENGAFIVRNDKELFSKTLDRTMVNEVIKDLNKLHDCKAVLCGKKSAYVLDKSTEFIDEVKKYYHRCAPANSFDEIDDELFKIAVYDPKGPANNSHLALSPKWSSLLQLTISGQVWLDIGRNDIDKGTAIKFLQSDFGVSETETMAFGDYYNDVSMLQNVYHSYVMENAPAGVKKHGRFIAKSNDENGVLRVIKHKVLQLEA